MITVQESAELHQELSEKELKAVTGGHKASGAPVPPPSLKVTMEDILVTSYA